MNDSPTNQVTPLFPNNSNSPNKNHPITLDEVVNELQTWRNQKPNRNTAIPDELWRKIFQLTAVLSPLKIKALLGISNAQYAKKYEEFYSTSAENASTPPIIKTTQPEQPKVAFCEVKTTTEPLYRPTSSLATHTIVVEFHRSDGQLMKIHTTNENFETLIRLFYENGYHASNHLKS